MVPKLLDIVILIPELIVDSLLDLHIIEENVGILLKSLILEREPEIKHLSLLDHHIPDFVHHQGMLLEFLIDLPEGVDLAAIWVASDQEAQLLELRGLLAGQGFQVVD